MEDFSVLIVDDSPTDRYLLKSNIEDIPVVKRILECESGDKALEFLRSYEDNRDKYGDQFPPLLIFLDVNMPGTNGLEFLEAFQELRSQHDHYRSCMVMMYSSSDQSSERKQALKWPFVLDFLVKGDLEKSALQKKLKDLAKRCWSIS